MRILAVHPSSLMYSRIYLRLELDDATESFVDRTRMGVA